MKSWIYICAYCEHDIVYSGESPPSLNEILTCTHCLREVLAIDVPLVHYRTSLGDGPLPVISGDQKI